MANFTKISFKKGELNKQLADLFKSLMEKGVVDALLSGTLTQGRELERFETLLAKLTHSEFAISFSSGTAAIHAALACLKLEPEDEVITSTLNFCSIANMVNLIGAKTVPPC